MRYWLGALVALVFTTFAQAAESCRLAGRINSIVSTKGLLLLADTSGPRGARLVPVKFSRAEVVSVSRDVVDPWQWQSRRTHLHKWPAGTLIIVIGHVDSSGVIWADRIEIPQTESR